MNLAVYGGTVNEKGKFIPDSPAEFVAEFERRVGKRVVVSVKEYRSRRTNPQNRYWWGVIVRMFAGVIPCTPEEAHEALKAELNSDLVVVGDRAIRVPRSTSDLNTAQFNELVEKAQRLASEMYDMVIPDPSSPAAQTLMDERLTA